MGLFSKIAGIFKGSEKKDKKNLDPENALEILMLVQEAMDSRNDPERLTAVLARIQQVANQELGKYLPLLTGPQLTQQEQLEVRRRAAAAKYEMAFDQHEEVSQAQTIRSQQVPDTEAQKKPTKPVMTKSPAQEPQAAQKPITVEVPITDQNQSTAKIEIQPDLMEKLIAAVQAHPQVFEKSSAAAPVQPKPQEKSAPIPQEQSKTEKPAPMIQDQPEIQVKPAVHAPTETNIAKKIAAMIQDQAEIQEKPVVNIHEEPKAQEKPVVNMPTQPNIAEKIAAIIQEQPKVQQKPAVNVDEQPKVQERPTIPVRTHPQTEQNTTHEIPEISKTRTLNEIMDSLPDSVREVINQSIKRNETSAAEPIVEKEPEPEVIRADRFVGKKILYAYGNSEEYNIIESTCAAWKIDLEMVANGLTAVKQFSASAPGTYDAIILEKSMPLMNGFMAAKCIRKDKHPESASIPVIVAAVGTPVGQLEREGEMISACLDQGTERELYDVFNAIWK